ncbi:hypothetical protein BAE44_0025987 [Dichanthelium oligosanthes]|uniref:DUF1618 domain-containing protein n=1 Tax=Dichanthelium oligosanthes TaxID=888268 RepID=A0A1E5UJE2_9POAL|nr:hypothetical protein BAE44_0025987 [Dichanthelium oligosanthes]
MEGTWELPMCERRLFVPELGSVFSVARGSNHWGECCQVFALDVEARPPVARRVWELPAERVEDFGVPEAYSLAYLGNGRFCVSRTVAVWVPTDGGSMCQERGTSFTLVDVSRLPSGELEVAKHGEAHCHVWLSGHSGHSTFLQSA